MKNESRENFSKIVELAPLNMATIAEIWLKTILPHRNKQHEKSDIILIHLDKLSLSDTSAFFSFKITKSLQMCPENTVSHNSFGDDRIS